MSPSADPKAFRTVLEQSKNIVAIAGAGLSAASGIPTFRGAGGLWRTYDATELATPSAFKSNPSLVWQFYHMRREVVLQAKPNAAHFALASLSIPQILSTLASPAAKFTLITQNVDGLSTIALQQASATFAAQQPQERASPRDLMPIIEMHGRLLETICTSCRARQPNSDSPICESLRGTENLIKEQERDIPVEDLPRCKTCGGLLRPGVVWFDERPHHLGKIDKIVDKADLALVIGTSSTVYPAASYAYEVSEHGGKVAVFNLEPTSGDDEADFLFLGPCEETLPLLLFGGESADSK